MSSVRLEHLSKHYGPQVAVAELDLKIASGELIVLVGPSGCGKTTTLRMIAGFIRPSSGTIRIGDALVTDLPPRARNIGMVFQDYALFPSMTVRQNIAFGLEEHKASPAHMRQRVDEMLDLIQMKTFSDRLPGELSGGQQQRVALARALAYDPGLLLMDEPFGALDQKLREDMQREFVRIQRRLEITTVFVTHDQQEAMALADRIIVMNAGRVEQMGPPSEIYAEPTTRFAATFIGRSNQFDATVIALEGRDFVRLRLATGEEVCARAATPGLRPGDDAVCMVRPEGLHPLFLDAGEHPPETMSAGNAPGQNAIEVMLRRRTFLGSIVDLIGETPAHNEVIVQLSPSDAGKLSVPGPIRLQFAPSDAFGFRREPS
jgi:ABC-type Fe3+/spermidine/putrescine transport system ATPase subunit